MYSRAMRFIHTEIRVGALQQSISVTDIGYRQAEGSQLYDDLKL